jgi:hypothetical protein
MATIPQRGVLRSLPALVALFFALFFSPQVAAPQAGPDVAASAVAPSETGSGLIQAAGPPAADEPAATDAAFVIAAPAAAVPDLPRVLRSQRIAGTAGSRAPPAAA